MVEICHKPSLDLYLREKRCLEQNSLTNSVNYKTISKLYQDRGFSKKILRIVNFRIKLRLLNRIVSTIILLRNRHNPLPKSLNSKDLKHGIRGILVKQ